MFLLMMMTLLMMMMMMMCRISIDEIVMFYDLTKVFKIHLTFTTLWAFSADGKLMIFFLFFPENRI